MFEFILFLNCFNNNNINQINFKNLKVNLKNYIYTQLFRVEKKNKNYVYKILLILNLKKKKKEANLCL